MNIIREPIKKTSIEKKNKIIEKGFELMCEKGYYNVSCVDIAKYAGVSTGIIYQYFNDKRDIFLAGAKDYSNKILFPLLDILDNQKIDINKFDRLITRLLDSFIETHTMSSKAHEELMAISHLDVEIDMLFHDKESEMTNKLSEILINNGFDKKDIKERIHIAIGIADTYCHDVVYHNHININNTKMKKYVVDTIINLIK